jgi:hypothetical protein
VQRFSESQSAMAKRALQSKADTTRVVPASWPGR